MDIQDFKEELKLNILKAKLLYTVYLQIFNLSNNDLRYEILEQINYLQKMISELSENLNKLGEVENELIQRLNKVAVH